MVGGQVSSLIRSYTIQRSIVLWAFRHHYSVPKKMIDNSAYTFMFRNENDAPDPIKVLQKNQYFVYSENIKKKQRNVNTVIN